MLSAESLEKHKQGFDTLKYEMKMDRVQSYVMDQQQYLHLYKSPNTSDAGSVPESCQNQGSLASITFSVSISELIKRKQRAAAQLKTSPSAVSTRPPYKQTLTNSYTQKTSNRPACENEQQRSPTLTHDNDRRDTKRRKSSALSKSPENVSPQPTPNIIKKAAHGMHLIQKFVSPNLEMSRITLKTNIKHPKLGLFRKGKSSALGKPVPDLTNFNGKLSEAPKESTKSTSCREELSKDPPSISKFFQRKPNKTATSILSNITNRSTPESTSPKSKSRTPKKEEEPDHKRKRSSSPIYKYEAFTNNSFDTIYQLLEDCQELNRLTSSKHHHLHGTPNYAHVKTPDALLHKTTNTTQRNNSFKHEASDLSFTSSNSLPRSFLRQYNLSSPPPSPPLPPSPRLYNGQMIKKEQQPYYRKDIFTPVWQVAESAVSFSARTAAEEYALLEREKADEAEEEDHTLTANDDLDLILHSRAMNMFGEYIQQNEKNIQNFWLNQPAFKRGV
ncbi:hypothetical protein [Parasitella parasitica]|uniref:Uncharacterized protein n=1 Tax=Parasitella parasitica TaxID=35722 RepID=A0A0B7NJG8_9FUNG|nr:hypothetical protein [Parasitella parasitica]